MKTPAPPAKPESDPGARFRKEIASALASGSSADELLLNVTLMDASKLKRDPKITVDEISFSEGEMRYLGVRVRQGGVLASQLGPWTEPEPPEPPPAKPKRKTAAKKAPAAVADEPAT